MEEELDEPLRWMSWLSAFTSLVFGRCQYGTAKFVQVSYLSNLLSVKAGGGFPVFPAFFVKLRVKSLYLRLVIHKIYSNMTEQEVRRYLRQMKEENSERAFHGFYDLTYDRLFRIAFYYLRREEWAQEVVLDVFMKLWGNA